MSEKKNIFLSNRTEEIKFSSPVKGGPSNPDRVIRDKESHYQFIKERFDESFKESKQLKEINPNQAKKGTYLEFTGTSLEGKGFAYKSLENISQGIRLLNIQFNDNVIKAIIYIPEGKEKHFLKKLHKYEVELTSKGQPKNGILINGIEDIKLALIDSFWIGKKDFMPLTDQSVWCEVWLRVDEKKNLSNVEVVTDKFFRCCLELNIEKRENYIKFPERSVHMIFANKNQLINLIFMCEYISEFRRAPDNVNFFMELSGSEQHQWVDELSERTTYKESNASICILDTGLNSKHPLIEPTVESDMSIMAVEDSWGVNDHEGHGTEMAGVAIYYDLKEQLGKTDEITISHKIESVKILPNRGGNDAELYGDITSRAVSVSEINNPNKERTFCMAVTSSEHNMDDGSPSSWSGAIDNITSGAEEDGQKRLFLISAGNLQIEEFENLEYPELNTISSVQNPAQSWNALTIGAYTKDIEIQSRDYREYQPLADVLELSPYSTTSNIWNSMWPIKPEILLDGGNVVTNGSDFMDCEDLSLLTTHKDFLNRDFSVIWGTSSATAQAAWMSAQLFANYPGIWPETVRALLVHSANWTENMKKQFLTDKSKTKGIKNLLRNCGYGIPNFKKAIECANNSVNLIIESEIQPYKKRDGKNSMNEMHLHKLPWPKEELRNLGAANAKLKVTLSYFIEPGPGEVGWKDKYRYASCGLRFDAINSNEELEDFKKRINNLDRGEDTKDKGEGTSRRWFLGTQNRNVGSIHSDFCVEAAVDLCETEFIAVYPVSGWWKERSHLGKLEKTVKYSLVVTIETPEVETDLYTPILTQVQQQISIEI